MNKCYFGNFQDFCKYGLLRELAKFADSHKFNLHFCQMITADDNTRIRSEEDFSYLQNDGLARYDEKLFYRLKRWRAKAPRGPYQWARESARIVSAKHNNKLIPKEEVARKNYFGETIAAAKRGDVIFFNPDYGLAFADRMLKENAPRYLKAEEIGDCVKSGVSVLFYQEALFPKAKNAADRLYRDVWRRLHDSGIRCRLYFFQSRAPSFTGQSKTADAGFFWVAPVAQIHAGRAELFAKEFKRATWCREFNNPRMKPMFGFERRVGFFVDVENVGLPFIKTAAEVIKSDIAFGKIVTGTMYGRRPLTKDKRQAYWKELGLDLCREVVGASNEADLGLSFDVARRIFDFGIDTAVVLSSDGGFVATAREAKKLNVVYWGIGDPKTPPAYARTCDRFYDIKTVAGKSVATIRKNTPE